MAIRGIDTQIMMNRMPENAKETSELMKRPVVVQDAMAQQSKINDAQDQSRVSKMSESEMEKLRADVEGGSDNEYEGEGGRHRKKKHEEEIDPTMLVPAGDNVIDIII